MVLPSPAKMSSPFLILNLTFLPLEQILLNFSCSDLIDFSLCSKKCKVAVKNIRNSFTGIEVYINTMQGFNVRVMRGFEQCVLSKFVTDPEHIPNIRDRSKNFNINGRAMQVFRGKGSKVFFISSPSNPELDLKSFLEFLMEILRIPVVVVDLRPDGVDGFMKYIQSFPVCQKFRLYEKNAISNEDLLLIKKNVKAGVFFRNGAPVRDK